MRFFRASSRSPSSGSSRQCLDPVKNDCIYHQSRRLPSCTGGRPYRSALARIADIGRHACVPLVFLVSGALLLRLPRMSVLPQPVGRKLARACPRPPRAAMGCFLRATACLRHAGPTLARPSGLAVHGRSKSWIASSSRSGRGLTNSSRLKNTENIGMALRKDD